MKKVIITGASSFIGRHLTKFLSEKGWKIYGVVRKKSQMGQMGRTTSGLTVLEMDMKEYGILSERIGEPCDVFVSLAWDGTRGESRMDAARQEKSYTYSMAALHEAVKLGCKTAVSAGSQAEYGPMPGNTRINEETECRPNTEYGKWKRQFFEDALRLCEENGVVFKEPRFFSLYGEGDYGNTLILSLLRNMMAGRSCRLTECVQMWDYLYVGDAIEGLFRLLESDCGSGAYNFASGDTRVLRDFVMEMYQITGSGSKLLFGEVPYPATGIVSICPDITKLQRATGWRAKTTFEEGIRKTMVFLQSGGRGAGCEEGICGSADVQ